MLRKEVISKTIFLSFLVFLPYLLGANIKHFDGFSIINNICFTCVIFIPKFFIKKAEIRKIYWLIFSFLFLAWSLVETLHMLQEKKEFDYLALKIFFESNARELLEYFLAIVPVWGLLSSLVVIILLVYALFKFPSRSFIKTRAEKKFGIGLFVISLCLFLMSIKTKEDCFGVFKNEAIAWEKLSLYYDGFYDSNTKIKFFFEKNEFKYIPTQSKNTYVLIIGESTSRHHLSLYGYFRNTNQLLSKRNDIEVFRDVISSGSSTIECLGKCLTFNDIDSNKSLASPNIIDICNNLGIKTFWLSNQNKTALVKNSITMAFSRAKKAVFLEDISENRMDENLLPELKEALVDTSQNKLIVLHLMGTHFEYNKRYPLSFNIFKEFTDLQTKFPFANSESKYEIINEYDNAVLYNDFVVNSVFEILKPYKSKENISAIYFSDHADEVFDTRDYVGHSPGSSSNWLHEIPLLTWNFTLEGIDKNAPFEMDEFAVSLCDWMQIKSKIFDAKKSIFNKSYLPSERYLSTGDLYKNEAILPKGNKD